MPGCRAGAVRLLLAAALVVTGFAVAGFGLAGLALARTDSGVGLPGWSGCCATLHPGGRTRVVFVAPAGPAPPVTAATAAAKQGWRGAEAVNDLRRRTFTPPVATR